MLERLKARARPSHLRLDQPLHRADVRRLFAEGKANGYLLKHPNGDRLADGSCGRRAWGLSTSRIPAACHGTARSCAPCSIWASIPSRPTSASAFRTNVVYHDGSRSGTHAQLLHIPLQPDGLRIARGGTGQGRGGGLRPLRHDRRAEVTRCTGAATANRPSRLMAETLRGGLSLGLSGFGFWSHDIGGFEGKPDAATLQALGSVWAALVAQPPARQRLLPCALAL